MSAAGFALMAVPPLLGRLLGEADEREGSAPVVVIGHELWRSRFGADPGVVGRSVRLGAVEHTVVGVMPAGFAFPLNHHIWAPLRVDAARLAAGEGPAIEAFARLRPGASIEEARAEIEALGRRAAALSPETHRHLRPRVSVYGPHLMDDLEGWEIPALQGLITLLLIIIAANVSVLVFARTATRSGEIAVRTALGASRARIVAQFFAEGLMLAGVAAAIGVGVAALVLRSLERVMDGALASMGGLPFWLDFRLTPGAVLLVLALATLSAVIVGVLPALRVTGTRLEPALRSLSGSTGLRMGRTWSLLIVAQVGFTVAILPATLFFAVDFGRHGMTRPGFPVEQYLTTDMRMDRPEGVPSTDSAFTAAYADRMDELLRRLQADPGVAAASLSVGTPAYEPSIRVQVEGEEEGSPGHHIHYNRVDPAFFGTYDIPLLVGRHLSRADQASAATPVVVNRAFVRDVLGGRRAALGKRIRVSEGYRSGGVTRVPAGLEQDRWYEIVGVVGDLPARPLAPGEPTARVYRPLDPAHAYPLTLTVRGRIVPATLAPRIRELAAAVDPALKADDLRTLAASFASVKGGLRLGALGLALLTGSVLLLSAAGIYAMMSFVVTQRRREIGIRTALGARPGKILATVFRRAFAQLGAGAGLGLLVAIGLNLLSNGETTGGQGALVLPAVAGLMLAVGMLATLGPARRGLGVEPVEALREQ